MTNREALLSSIGYPFTPGEVELACINNGLEADGNYSAASKPFELAKAELCLVAYNKPNISEGGFSVNIAEKKSYRAMRKAIFKKYGLVDTFTDDEPTISSCSPW